MKRTTVVLLLLLLVAVVIGGTASKNLSQLKAKCALLLYHMNYREVDSVSSLMMQVAEKEKNQRMQGYAQFYKGAAQMMMGLGQKALPYLHKAHDLSLTVVDDTLTALTLNSLAIYEGSVNANMYVAQRYFLESLRYAEKSHYETIKGGIYGNLSEVAINQKDTTGIKYAMKCLEQGRKEDNANLQYMGAIHTAQFLNLMKRNDEALCYIDSAMAMNKIHHFSDTGVLYILHGTVLCDINRMDEAAVSCRKSVEMVADDLPTMLPQAYYQSARVCFKQGDYNQSLVMLQKAVEAAETNNSFAEIVDIYALMAQCHEQLGHTEQALKYLKQAGDSAHVANQQAQQHLVSERNMVIDMMEREQEIALREAKMQTMERSVVLLSVAAILLMVLLIVAVSSYRRRTRLYHNIVQQNTRALERENELQQRIKLLKESETAKEEIKEERRDGKKDSMNELWLRLQTMMEQERIYTDNQLDREKLAQLLGTNRTYLTTLISERTGMNYTQFVNSYRINDAVRILSDKQRADYPLKNICADLGFGSMSHFHKIFRENVGMSPSAYRNSAMRI